MSDKKFDKILQEKLIGYQITFDESRWEDMEKVLNQNEQSDLIDQEVRHRLQKHTYPYQESHWQILKRKLELEKELKEKIYISKIAEVSILMLLLLSAINLKENYAPKSSSESFVSAIDAHAQDNLQNHAQESAQELESTLTQPITTQFNDESKTSIQEVKKDQSGIIANTKNNTIQGLNSSTSIPITFTAASYDEKIVETESSSNDIISLQKNPTHSTFGQLAGEESNINIQILDPDKSNIPLTESPAGKQTVNGEQPSHEVNSSQKIIVDTAIEPVTNRALIPTSSRLSTAPTSQLAYDDHSKLELTTNMIASLLDRQVDIAALQSKDSDLVAAMTIAQPYKRKERWIGAMTGVDMNYVRSRIDINNVSGPRNYLVLSLTTGVNYSVQKGRNEFFTGIGYSEKFYDPNIVETVQLPSTLNSIESSSYYSRDYTLEQYDIVHIPAQYRRHLGNAQKLHAYAFAGASINIVIYTDYEQHDNLNRGQPRPKRLVDQTSAYKATDFSRGLLEGGYYKDNIYFTADVGFGLEKQIKSTKLFLESQYKRNLFASQLGPQNVRLNSLSFNVGAKYKI